MYTIKPTELYLPNNIFGCAPIRFCTLFSFVEYWDRMYISDNAVVKYTEAAIDVQSDMDKAVHFSE